MNNHKASYEMQRVIKQLEFESNSSKRLLAFIIDENIHLKNRLSEILKDDFDKAQLDKMEIFFTHFLKLDELTAVLRKELAVTEKLFIEEFGNDENIQEVAQKVKELYNSIITAETQFSKVRFAFNKFLSANILVQ